MKESYHESLANCMSPESCLDGPRGRGEALTGGNAGVVLSSENTAFRRPSQWTAAKATYPGTLSKTPDAPAESETNACADMFHAGIGISRKGVCRATGTYLDKRLPINRICKSEPSERALELFFGGQNRF